MANNFAYIGQELKYTVSITALGFSMDDDDFEIVVSVGKQKKVYKKSDILMDDQGVYYIAIDTSGFKPGDLYATVYAYVPDEDYPDGIRTEIAQQKLIPLKKLS